MTNQPPAVALSEVCDVRKGTSITQSKTRPGQVPVVAGGMSFAYTHDAPNRDRGAITVSASGANAGFVNYWEVPIFASDCTTIEPLKPEALDRRFLYRQLKALEGMIQRTFAKGAAQPHVYPKDLATIPIDLPPVEEQRRIAAILDAADALRAKRRQALARLEALTQAIFVEMFRGRGWGAWPTEPIASLANQQKGSIRTGPFGSQLLHEEFTDEGVAVLGIDNAVQNQFVWGERRFISPEKYEQLKRYTVLPGDVLVTIMGTCGRVSIVPEDIPTAINTKHLCCITLDSKNCRPEWLWASLRFHPLVLRQLGATHGAVMPGLNMGKIKQAEIPVPPIDVQLRFVERKNAAERHIESGRASSSRLDTLFASLQQRAFRGEL